MESQTVYINECEIDDYLTELIKLFYYLKFSQLHPKYWNWLIAMLVRQDSKTHNAKVCTPLL